VAGVLGDLDDGVHNVLPLQAPATLKRATNLIVHADRGTDLKLSGTKRLVKLWSLPPSWGGCSWRSR